MPLALAPHLDWRGDSSAEPTRGPKAQAQAIRTARRPTRTSFRLENAAPTPILGSPRTDGPTTSVRGGPHGKLLRTFSQCGGRRVGEIMNASRWRSRRAVGRRQAMSRSRCSGTGCVRGEGGRHGEATVPLRTFFRTLYM